MSRAIPFAIRKHPPGSPERKGAVETELGGLCAELENPHSFAEVERQSHRLRLILAAAGFTIPDFRKVKK